jgi:hypothetical protein
MKRIGIVVALVLSLIVPTSSRASAAVTWSQTSKIDVAFDGKFYNPQYDIQYSSTYIFDNDPDSIYFYLEFLQVPTVKMFNDNKESFASIKLDYDFDGETDVSLYTENTDLKTNLVSVPGYAYDSRTDKDLGCPVGVFTDIASQSKWVGFTVSRSCIKLPSTFNQFGLARFDSLNREDSFDFAPNPAFKVTLPTSATSSAGTSTGASKTGATYTLPINKLNSSTSANSYSDSPEDLSKLSENLLPSVVTVQCGEGSGTGWSADATLGSTMQSAGFLSLILTNHHVVVDCLGTKSVTLILSNGTSIAGTIVSWNEDLDLAGIATKTVIPPLQWIGSRPKQGWWVGVLGSPLGSSGILTTGIISSVNSISQTFTFTAAINPGNSGGPVFDSTGRVLGLATSKRLITSEIIAEGFGNAQGTPLLCNSIVQCVAEKSPWGATPKFSSGPSASEIAATSAAKIAQEKAVAEAKAAAEAVAKIAQEKAIAEVKSAIEAAAKAAQEKAVAEAKASAEAAAKAAQDKAIADAKASAEAAAKAAQDKLVSENLTITERLNKLQSEYSALSATFASNLTKYSEAIAQVTLLQGVLKTLQAQVADYLTPKPETIICTKGISFKIVKAIAPKCPAGYKRR